MSATSTPREFLSGTSAVVRFLLDQMSMDRAAGWDTRAFVSGYPGSPLGGLDLQLARRRAAIESTGVVHQPALNEELAATAVFGSQVASATEGFRGDGVLGLWYGKAPGLDRATDALRHGNHLGTGPRSGAVVLVGDDPSCKSSTLPSSSEGSLADLQMPTLHPGDTQELLDLAHHAVALSRFSGLWVALKIVSEVADGSGLVDVGPDRFTGVLPEPGPSLRALVPRLHRPYTAEMEREIAELRLPRAARYGSVNALNHVTSGSDDAWLGVLASGHTYVNVVEAFRLLGYGQDELSALGVRLIQVRQLFPLDAAQLRSLAAGLDTLLVVEERAPFLETHIRDALYGMANPPAVLGKKSESGASLVPAWGALDSDAVAAVLARCLTTRIDPARLRPPTVPRSLLPIVSARPPWFCSGCPHSTSTRVPDGALVGTGIGCHAMASRMEPDRVGTVLSNTQMGGEGAQWIGAAPFLDRTHLIQNIGDGTLAHSGWLAVRFAVAAHSNITFKLLYNGAVAMTGGQDAVGSRSVPDIVAGLRAEGVGRIIVTTEDVSRYRRVRMTAGVPVWDRSRIVEAQELLAAEPGVTVLIHDQECAAELRRARRRGRVPTPAERVEVNERVCEGCGDCGAKSACLSVQTVETEFGPKVRIHQDSCNFDYSCVEGDCPSFTLVSAAPTRRLFSRAATAAQSPDLGEPPAAPEPPALTGADEYVIRIPGVGGTGVVTLAQVIAVAATIDGYEVRGLDQTGLSQKAGPVVSDLRILRGSAQSRPGHSSAGSVDLYLAMDAVVGLSPEYAAGLSPSTAIVGSSSWSPPGTVIGRPDASAAELAQLRAALAQQIGGAGFWIDADERATTLTGAASTANMLLLGVAHQLGRLPLTAVAIEQAIERNGVAVAANVAAFRWGRAAAVDPQVGARSGPAVVAQELPARLRLRVDGLAVGPELHAMLAARAADLVAYQNAAYAARYLTTVERAATTGDAAFVEAVGVNLHKLMAYKDEYEVARLHLAHPSRSGERTTLLLHPPLLRALGLRHKLRFGPRTRPLLRLLATARGVRGTPFDVFGIAGLRRTERRLVAEYEGVVEDLTRSFSPVSRDDAVRVAGLPQMIRGYEGIKVESIRRYDVELAAGRTIVAETTERQLSSPGS